MWFVQQSELNSSAIEQWAELHSRQPEQPFYLHPDWISALGQHLFDQTSTLKVISLSRKRNPSDSPHTSQPESARLDDADSVHQKNLSRPCTPQLMLLCQCEAGSVLSAPRHDHLTLGDVLIDQSLSASEVKSALAAVMQSQDASRLQFSNLPARSRLMTSLAVAGPDSPDGSESRSEPGSESGSGQESQDQACHAAVLDPLWVCSKARQSAWFDLAADVAIPGGKLRRNLSRLQRKLQQRGEVSVRCLEQGTDQHMAMFENFLAVEASGWKGMDGSATAIAGHHGLRDFYASLLQPRYPGMRVVLNQLSVADEVVAVQYGLLTGKSLYLLKIGFLESFAEFSPGSLLLQAVIERAREQGIENLSLVTSPVWAERWHPQIEDVWRMNRHRSTWRALGARKLIDIKQQLRARIGR